MDIIHLLLIIAAIVLLGYLYSRHKEKKRIAEIRERHATQGPTDRYGQKRRN